MSFLFRLFIYLTIYLFGLHLEVVQRGKGEMCGCGPAFVSALRGWG